MKWVKVAVRMSLLLGVCLTALAVGVARLVPSVELSSTVARHPARSALVGVNTYAMEAQSGSTLLDPRTGDVTTIALKDTESLLFAKSSPWEDGNGETEVVGRWVSREPSDWSTQTQEIGVARFAMPSGRQLDHVPLDVVPAGNPCWYPGTTSRILYAGTDGKLYSLQFHDGAAGQFEPPAKPEIITWACRQPGRGEARITDPVWPADPRMKGRLVVSLTYLDALDTPDAFVPEQIWWFELSRDGKSITAAGRLTAPRSTRAPRVQERLPSLAITDGDEAVMAYLSRPAGQSTWDLKLAPVAFHPATGEARARTRMATLLARNVVVTFPAFSPDGRWVNALRMPVRSTMHADRFSVAEALASRPQPWLSWHSRRAAPAGSAPALRTDRSPSKS